MSVAVDALVGSIINKKYEVGTRIGGGSFGEIYRCTDLADSKEYAAKFEKKTHSSPQLRHEYKVYRELKESTGICTAQYFGEHLMYRVLVIELMGPSLEDFFDKCGKKFSLKTVLQIADQLIQRVTALHVKSIIHRDIKPQNFVVGLGGQSNTVYCLDFGLAKLYRDRRTLRHLPKREGSLAGTPRYASINNHLGIAQSRRDDLESVAYMLIYFLKGKLPWQGLKAAYKGTKYRLILQGKQKTSVEDLCRFIPLEFATFLKYARELRFDQDPDVDKMRRLFHDLYVRRGYSEDEGPMWDWDSIPTQELPPPPAAGTSLPPCPPDAPVELVEGSKLDAKEDHGDEDSLAPIVGKEWGAGPGGD